MKVASGRSQEPHVGLGGPAGSVSSFLMCLGLGLGCRWHCHAPKFSGNGPHFPPSRAGHGFPLGPSLVEGTGTARQVSRLLGGAPPLVLSPRARAELGQVLGCLLPLCLAAFPQVHPRGGTRLPPHLGCTSRSSNSSSMVVSLSDFLPFFFSDLSGNLCSVENFPRGFWLCQYKRFPPGSCSFYRGCA